MRRREKEIRSREEIDEIIRGSQVCRVALVVNTLPYLVPLSYGYDGGAIYLPTAQEGRKIRCLEANPRVCFEFEHNVKVVRERNDACKWSFSYESVIGYGTVQELVDPEQKRHGLNQIMLHYSGREWEFKEATLAKTRVWKISIDSLSGKRSEDRSLPAVRSSRSGKPRG